MKITILGAGVIGVTSAYLLAEQGHEVEVIDRGSQPASETSHANGGQLSFSHAEPWANPHVLKKVFGWMLRDDAPLVLRPSADPRMLSWTLDFLRQCQKHHSLENSRRLLRLGLYSKKQTEAIRLSSGVAFDHISKGILHVYTHKDDLEHAKEQAAYQNSVVDDAEHMIALDRDGVFAREPSLAFSNRPVVGGILCTVDETGDCGMFTENLAKVAAERFKVQFSYNTHVTRLNVERGKIKSVLTSHGLKQADVFVLCLGSYSYDLLKQIGLNTHLYPMKGYSITVPVGEHAPQISITDNEKKIVITRLGNHLRTAGTAEFAGYNTALKEKRILPILKATQSWFPDADYSEESMFKWACLRPSTPDGLPIIGHTKYDNLYVNTGHGTLGWTQSCGSAKLLCDLIHKKEPEIPLEGMTIDRYN